MLHSLKTFFQFFRRDWYVYWHRNTHYIINYGILFPVLFSVTFCYIQPAVYFGANNALMGTTVFIGHILIIILVLAFNLMMKMLFDLEGDRYINFQIALLSPRLVLLERIFFCSVFVFIMGLPFFPVAKLLMQDHFVTAEVSWPIVIIMLYLSALCCAAYMQCIICVINNIRTVRRFWMRVNFMLITLGGLFIPWHIVSDFSPTLGYITLLNPLIYITEGLRRAIIGTPNFLPVTTCAIALVVYSCLFIM